MEKKIQYLPNDMLIAINQYLPIRDVMTFGSTNQVNRKLIKGYPWIYLIEKLCYLNAGFNMRRCHVKLSYEIITKHVLTKLRTVNRLTFVKCTFLTLTRDELNVLRNVRSITLIHCPSAPQKQMSELNIVHFYGDSYDYNWRYYSRVKRIELRYNYYGVCNCKFGHLSGINEVNLTKFDLSKIDLSDLAGVRKLILFECDNITNDDLVNLIGVEKLYLCGCNGIVPNGKYLDRFTSVKVLSKSDIANGVHKRYGVYPVSDPFNGPYRLDIVKENTNSLAGSRRMRFLGTLNELTLDCYIPADDFKSLSRVKKLRLVNLTVSDDALFHLRNNRMLTLINCKGITNEGYRHLSNIPVLNLCIMPVMDDGMSFLKGNQILNLSICDNVTDKGIAHLSHLDKLSLMSVPLITNSGLTILGNIPDLYIENCSSITPSCFNNINNKNISLLYNGFYIEPRAHTEEIRNELKQKFPEMIIDFITDPVYLKYTLQKD